MCRQHRTVLLCFVLGQKKKTKFKQKKKKEKERKGEKERAGVIWHRRSGDEHQ